MKECRESNSKNRENKGEKGDYGKKKMEVSKVQRLFFNASLFFCLTGVP